MKYEISKEELEEIKSRLYDIGLLSIKIINNDQIPKDEAWEVAVAINSKAKKLHKQLSRMNPELED